MSRLLSFASFLFVALITSYAFSAATDNCDGTTFQIQDDPNLNQIIAGARQEFLQTRPTYSPKVTYLDATILFPDRSNGTTVWKRGSFNQEALGYPASTVKLAYMAAAVQYCLDKRRLPDCLDRHVRPMVKDSDNLQTGIVVDIGSNAPNVNITSLSDPLFAPWYQKRLWAMNYLSKHKLLGNQTVSVKTYPTNTGQTLWGAENLAWETYGRNNMCSKCAASLMLEVTQGGLYGSRPDSATYYGATEYMRGLLSHNPWSDETSFGFGVPPGTLLLNKIGVAYNNLNDIAYVQLPNGMEFILAAYSDSYEPNQPMPYDGSNLGTFMSLVIQGMHSYVVTNCTSLPIISSMLDNGFSAEPPGEWGMLQANDAVGMNYYYSAGPNTQFAWNVTIPSTGLYEICVWSPQAPTFSNATIMQVNSATGQYNYTVSQQQYGGRWYKLGDFYLNKGEASRVVALIQTPQNAQSGPIVANEIKLTKWPECHDSPGATCLDFDPTGSPCPSSTTLLH